MPDLTKEQLAEGRRLMKLRGILPSDLRKHVAFDGMPQNLADFLEWVDLHATALLSAAEAEASAAEFAGALDESLTAAIAVEQRMIEEADTGDERVHHESFCCGIRAARIGLLELAAQRGIELTATAAGEAQKGGWRELH